MQLIPRENILISPNRQRREFDAGAISELADSITKLGLLHPIVVRPADDGSKSTFILVAGERRLRALDLLRSLEQDFRCGDGASIISPYIPCTTLWELSPLEAEEAELDENLKRQDLTWDERAAAIARLHALRLKQFPGRTVADTAAEVFEVPPGKDAVGAQITRTRRDLILAQHLDKPEIAKAKTADEAMKILRKQETARANIILAEEVGKTFSSESHQLFNTDCLQWMRDYSGPLFDVILTDPPYGMDAHKFRDSDGKFLNFSHEYDDSLESWIDLMTSWTQLSYAITKPEAHAYVFCDFDRFHDLKQLMQNAGWYVFRTPITVYKLGNSGRVPLPDLGPRRQTEWCLYAIKGSKPTKYIGLDIIPCASDNSSNHGAGKPVELFFDLLRRSVSPGDLLLDTFAGTGPIFPAANRLLCSAVGVEIDPASYGIALQRLNQK